MMKSNSKTDQALAIRVTRALKHLVGGNKREQVVKWLTERGWFVSQSMPRLTEIDWSTADYTALGQSIYDVWCEVTLNKPVDGRANVGAVMSRLARKLGYADIEAMDEQEVHHLQERLKTYIWRDDYLICQALDAKDLDYAANTFWSREVAKRLTDADHAAIEQRRRESSPLREYEDAELRPLILQWLLRNRRYAFTYGEAAKEFRCDWKQASRIMHSLATRSPDVVMYQKSWVDTTGKKRSKKLFKFCPERKLMDTDYTQARQIVSRVLLKFIAAHPEETKRSIRAAMREYFGYIDDKTVDDALAKLVADGRVCYKLGKQGAHRHYLPQPVGVDFVAS